MFQNALSEVIYCLQICVCCNGSRVSKKRRTLMWASLLSYKLAHKHSISQVSLSTVSLSQVNLYSCFPFSLLQGLRMHLHGFQIILLFTIQTMFGIKLSKSNALAQKISISHVYLSMPLQATYVNLERYCHKTTFDQSYMHILRGVVPYANKNDWIPQDFEGGIKYEQMQQGLN